MKEIKFRAWDRNYEEIIEWYSMFDSDDATGKEFFVYCFDEDHLIYMQYTGLKDKNGKEIYEGDILQSYKGIVEVYWVEDEAMFRIEPDYTWFDRVARDSRTVVIGNIYENPELLEAKK